MGKHYAHHLTEDRDRRAARGFGFGSSDTGIQNARGMLEWILKEKKIPGGNQKGYFYRTQRMPHSVSFSDLPLERLGKLVRDRSYYGIAMQKSRFPKDKLREVIYLTDDNIREFSLAEERWLVDLVRSNDIYFAYADELEENFEGLVAKAYDYSWQKELRIKCSGIRLSNGPDFVFVPDSDEIRRFNEMFGVEAYALKLHFARLREIYKKQGKVVPVEELLFSVLQEMRGEGKKTDRESGRFVFDEAVERVWEKVNKLTKNT